MPDNANIVDLKHVSVTFKQKKKEIKAVNDVTLQVPKGKIFGIAGFSGAGKSTLVRTINLLQKPSAGTVDVFHKTFFKKTKNESYEIPIKELRKERQKIGMIFQHFNLLEEQTVEDNVAFALRHSGLKDKQVKAQVLKVLKEVDLENYAKAYPAQLSGGQQQRVAIARALVNKPEILISDEATSALDPQNTNQILDLLKKVNQKYGVTILLITHEMDAIKRICDEVSVMSQGKIIQTGDLIDIFVDSENPTVRKVVGGDFDALSILHSLHISLKNRRLVQLTYFAGNVNDPVIIDLYAKFHVTSSIVYSNIEELGTQTVGTIIAEVKGSEDDIKKSIKYLEDKNIKVNEVKED